MALKLTSAALVLSVEHLQSSSLWTQFNNSPLDIGSITLLNYIFHRANEYTTIYNSLRQASESKILIPAAGTFQRGASAAIVQNVPAAKRIFLLSPIIYLKAQKNAAEIKGMRKAHLRDAVAMCTLLSYLEVIWFVNIESMLYR